MSRIGAPKLDYPHRSGHSPVIALGRLTGLFGGGGTSWTGNHPGWSNTITDTAAGNYTVNLPINFATALVNVHAQAITARIQVACILSAGPALNGIATTNVQVLCRNDAGALANATVLLVAFDTADMGEKGSPIVAMGQMTEVGLAGTFVGAHPGFNATIANNGGTAGDYTVTAFAQSNAAQLNLLVQCATDDAHAMVIKTNVPGGGTTFRIVTLDNAAAAKESSLMLTLVETMPNLGANPAVAVGALHEPGGGPGSWMEISHHGFADTPITRNAQGDYTVTMGADNTTQTIGLFATVITAAAPDTIPYLSFPTATTARVVVKDSANGALDADLELTAIII